MEKAIPIENRDDASRLFGVYDRNLKRIREKTGARVTVRNGAIRITGTKAEVDAAAAAFERVREIIDARGDISEEDLDEVLSPRRRASDSAATGSFVPATAFRRVVTVEGKSDGQNKYLEEMDKSDIVFAIGPAGTGKTFLAVAKAVEALKAGQVRRIVLVRPAVEAGERLGFLPGDIQAKVNPYLRPIYDSLNSFLEYGQLQRLISADVVEICPLAFMRGRTLDEAFIILDEAQNTTGDQMRMFLTRMGGRSKIVVTGDITQTDLPPGKTSGLVEAKEVLKGIPGIGFSYFTRADIVRHPLVQRIVDAYDERRRRPFR